MMDLGDEERDDFARQSGVQLRRQRRSPPRLPAGTLRVHGDDARGCIPITSGAFLTEREKGLFRLIVGQVMNPIRYGVDDNLPVADDHRYALGCIARALFGCDPDDALWLEPFLVELEVARCKRLALESRDVNPGNTNLLPLAQEAIERARRRAQRLAPSIELPRWLSPRLAALFLKRFSFTGGGGPHAALTRDSIRRYLADTGHLSKYLRFSSARARYFAEELAFLEAPARATTERESVPKPARPDLIDEEHASASERRAAREMASANQPASMARVASSSFVCCERGFVGLRFDALASVSRSAHPK